MAISRRKFIQVLGTAAAVSAVKPSTELIAAEKDGRGINDTMYAPEDYDVIVAGAGPAGIAAAVAAARNGAKVALLEEDMTPGGAPVDMFVTFMCGGPRVGLFRELVGNLNRNFPIGGAPCRTFGVDGSDGRNHWWMPSSFAIEYRRLIDRYQNISLFCGVPVINAIVKKGKGKNKVMGVRVLRNGTIQEFYAPVTIDATGNACVASSAGCRILYGSEAKKDFGESYGLEVSDGKVQPCTQMYISQRVRNDAVFPIEKFKSGVLEDNNRKWAQEQDRDEFFKNSTPVFLHWGVSTYCSDTTDPVAVGKAQMKVQKDMEKYVKILGDSGFAVQMAPKIGVRESRRVVGEYVLTVDDLFGGMQPEDKIADASYPIDAWGWNIPASIKHSVKPYGIPYRCLVPSGVEGLLTAGRIISGTRLANSSYRVQPICSSVGEAAGTAAAMASLGGKSVRGIDIAELQDNLRKYGVIK